MLHFEAFHGMIAEKQLKILYMYMRGDEMRCKIGIVSIGMLSRALAQEVEYLHLDADFVFSETLMDERITLPIELEDADVLVSSGYNTKLLRRVTDKPIINIEPSLYDILSAYSEAITYENSHPVIIFPIKQYTNLTERIKNILAVPITVDAYDNVADLPRLIQKHWNEGCRCIIGSGLVCDEARLFGMHTVFLYPSESLRTYIQMAYDSAAALRVKTQENKLMDLAINNARNAILFTDERGTILICNQNAQQLFLNKIHDHLTQHSIFEIMDAPAVQQLYTEHIPARNVILDLVSGQHILSGYPIYLRKNVTNVMVTLDSIEWIQKKELHIRQALSEKGFTAKHHFSDMVSRSERFNALVQTAKRFARHEDSVLILGSTGTGKEVLAQSIHNHSLRAENPFVAVNCSSITESLLESELFGYDEGAFTGAKKGGKPGYFEMAHTGTIFLDEISELSLPMQSKLLRAIQEKQIIHVGGNRVIHFDARIIAAANRDLWKMACEHQFREDLYYRLAVLELNIPALKDRQEDILPLFFKFMFHLNPELSSRFQAHADQLEPLLCSYSWPGNIRELENFAHMISVTAGAADSSETLMAVITTEIYRRIARTEPVSAAAAPPLSAASLPIQAGTLLSEQDRIRYALAQANGNCTQAAGLLNISRTTLWRKMKAMGLSSDKGTDEND